MKTTLLAVGKTDSKVLDGLIGDYVGRANRFVPLEVECIPDLRATKSLSEAQQKDAEGRLIAARLQPSDFVVLLDEKGREYSSREFSARLSQWFNQGPRRLVFVIGGPYGFSDKVYGRANALVSLSRMTFSHQMVRLLFVEQFYRALTILHHQPYHHD